jgi:O-antigen/teichoic acid export membrane protein
MRWPSPAEARSGVAVRSFLIPAFIPRLSPAGAIDAARKMIAGDTAIVVGTMLIQNMIRVVGSMILTRMLSAEAFGVIGVISSVAVTFGLLSDIGIVAFVVRHERSNERTFLDEVWTLRMIRSLLLTTGVFLLAGPISQFLGKPELHWPIAVGGLLFFFEGCSALSTVTAVRNRQLKRLSAIDIGTQIFTMTATIGMALIFRNYWAIIIANNMTLILSMWLSYAMFPDSARRWRYSRERVREMWKFSRFITGSTMLTLVIGQADKIVLSKTFPLAMFGLYMLASGLAAAPVGLVSGYVGRVLYPRLAEVARRAPERMRTEFYATRMKPALLYGFAVGGLIGVSQLLVELLYDPRYLQAGHYLGILAISSFFMMSSSSINEVMIATGHQRYTFTANVARLGYLVLGGALAYHYAGPIGVIWVVGTIELMAQIFGWTALARHRLLDIPRELLILLAGAGGIATGWVGQWVIRMLFHIH